MDIIKRIKELRDSRGWSTNQLALEAELTQSTLASLLSPKQNSLPSLETLMRLCNAFGITLAQFFLDAETGELVSAQEKLMLEQFRKLSKSKREAVLLLLSDEKTS